MADSTLHRGAAPRQIPLWVEPYAGSLAVGLRLLGASHLVGWMGGKSRYADAIMSILNVDACDEVFARFGEPEWSNDHADRFWIAADAPGKVFVRFEYVDGRVGEISVTLRTSEQ